MRRVALIALVLVTAVLLQTSLFPHLALAGFRPDLVVLATVAFALEEGPSSGMRVGFAGGVLADLLVNHSAVGLSALVYVAIGYGVGVARPYIAPGSVTAPLIAAFLSGFVGDGGFGLLSRLLGDETYGAFFILESALLVALYNAFLAPAVFALVRRLSHRFPVETTSLAR